MYGIYFSLTLVMPSFIMICMKKFIWIPVLVFFLNDSHPLHIRHLFANYANLSMVLDKPLDNSIQNCYLHYFNMTFFNPNVIIDFSLKDVALILLPC